MVFFSYVCPSHPTKRNMAVSELAYTHQKSASMCMINPGCWGTNPIPLVSKTFFLWPRRIMWFYLLLFILVSSRWLILYRGMGLFNTVICRSVLYSFIMLYIFPLWQNYSHDFTSEKVFPSSSYPFENLTTRKNRWKNEATTVPIQATPRQGFWWPRAARNATGRRRHLNILEHGESIMKNAWQKWGFQSRTTGI